MTIELLSTFLLSQVPHTAPTVKPKQWLRATWTKFLDCVSPSFHPVSFCRTKKLVLVSTQNVHCSGRSMCAPIFFESSFLCKRFEVCTHTSANVIRPIENESLKVQWHCFDSLMLVLSHGMIFLIVSFVFSWHRDTRRYCLYHHNTRHLPFAVNLVDK